MRGISTDADAEHSTDHVVYGGVKILQPGNVPQFVLCHRR